MLKGSQGLADVKKMRATEFPCSRALWQALVMDKTASVATLKSPIKTQSLTVCVMEKIASSNCDKSRSQ